MILKQAYKSFIHMKLVITSLDDHCQIDWVWGCILANFPFREEAISMINMVNPGPVPYYESYLGKRKVIIVLTKITFHFEVPRCKKTPFSIHYTFINECICELDSFWKKPILITFGMNVLGSLNLKVFANLGDRIPEAGLHKVSNG